VASLGEAGLRAEELIDARGYCRFAAARRADEGPDGRTRPDDSVVVTDRRTRLGDQSVTVIERSFARGVRAKARGHRLCLRMTSAALLHQGWPSRAGRSSKVRPSARVSD
jgi:hypothetical protein